MWWKCFLRNLEDERISKEIIIWLLEVKDFRLGL